MLPGLKYNLTNWVDGMKINRQHFIDSENALIDNIRDANASTIKDYEYGLLEPLPNEKTSLICEVINTQTNQFKIIVSQCRAVTSGGNRIEILQGIHQELTSDTKELNNDISNSNTNAFLVVISADPFNRMPFGNANSDEYPPRNQFNITNYNVHLLDENLIHASSLGANSMPIARLVVKNSNELIKDVSYIPPCTTLLAHNDTRILCNTVGEFYDNIQQYSFEIIQKVENNNQQTALALNISKICQNIAFHISSSFFMFRTVYKNQSPVYLANTIYQLASIINSSLNCLSSKDKEEVLTYFSYWNEMQPGKFLELLTEIINADYKHENIFESFKLNMEFLKTWSKLLDELKNLKLLGEKSKNSIFDGGRIGETNNSFNNNTNNAPPRKKSIFD